MKHAQIRRRPHRSIRRLAAPVVLGLAAISGPRAAGAGSVSAHRGVGVVAAPASAVSLAYGSTRESVWHGTAAYGTDATAVSLDHQWRTTPRFGWGRGWRLDVYGGVGLGAAADDERPDEEDFRLRIPAGAEIRWEALHLETFLEAAAAMGPLPRTGVAAGYAGGLRATF